jgi:hypothetical protein
MQSANTKLFTALIVILGLAIGYVCYSQLVAPQEEPVTAVTTSRNDLSSLKDMNLDFKKFDNAAYKALVIHGEVPVSPGATGKKDVFAP